MLVCIAARSAKYGLFMSFSSFFSADLFFSVRLEILAIHLANCSVNLQAVNARLHSSAMDFTLPIKVEIGF